MKLDECLQLLESNGHLLSLVEGHVVFRSTRLVANHDDRQSLARKKTRQDDARIFIDEIMLLCNDQ